MSLTSIVSLVVFIRITPATSFSTALSPGTYDTNATIISQITCPEFGRVDNGIVTVISGGSDQIASVQCDDNYDLDGPPNVSCIEGKWMYILRPQCSKRCPSPPHLQNGNWQIEGDKDENGMYSKGTLITYSCREGFKLTPSESQYRVCERGIWTGIYAICESNKRITNCTPPKGIDNGYFVQETSGEFDEYSVGQRLHFSCRSGFVLFGTSVQQCLEDGTWSPKIPPVCSKQITEDDYPCPVLPSVPHTYTILVQGNQLKNLATAGTILQIHCSSRYRNIKAPCQPGKLQCMGGKWVGVKPVCEPVRDCDPPPAVPYAIINTVNRAVYDSKYPIKSLISYQCLSGYALQGTEIFSCSLGGCWLPLEPPTCYRTPSNNYFLEVNNLNAILISTATGAGVLGLLLVICLITVCRRRKSLSRAVPISPPVPRPDLGDHASLLHHPDPLAFIAFADGLQNDQATLPTYDEATRDRAPNLTSSRLHRPHWPILGTRRSRNAPNPDVYTRHGSLASHTPSTRSAGDSMGSTDTVAVSEGSTNVTLDTASSYSGSQPGSCRVHCGSLASFDTSSVVNTDGVPLLEESEVEEIQGGDNISLVVDNPSISDNASFKLSTNSAEFS